MAPFQSALMLVESLRQRVVAASLHSPTIRLSRLKAATAFPSSSTAIAWRICFFSSVTSSSSSSSSVRGLKATTFFEMSGVWLSAANRALRFRLFRRPRWRRSLALGNLARTDEVVFDAHDGAAGERAQGFGEDEKLTRAPGLETDLAAIGFRADRFLRYRHDPLRLHRGLERSILRGSIEAR